MALAWIYNKPYLRRFGRRRARKSGWPQCYSAHRKKRARWISGSYKYRAEMISGDDTDRKAGPRIYGIISRWGWITGFRSDTAQVWMHGKSSAKRTTA